MTATQPAPRRSRTVMFAAIGVGIVMLLLVVLLVTRKNAEERSTDSPLLGKTAPALNGDPLQGEAFDIGTTDRWLLVNFFATWCVPCVEEHPQLRKVAEDGAESGQVEVVSVVYGDQAADVERFFEEKGGDWTVLDSDDGRTALDWGVAKVPESFLVSPTGVVVERFQGGVVAQDVEDLIQQYEDRASSGSTDGGGS
ncbi:MAG TPA: redoxin family protein [Acidimicrobiales bacterium]|jgi:cytochrome c biogenesis protein CcmG/thiol:disulfide interchange protein DsbE|nr:redoxin family protein [Acidimicrobiales bacterium]